jgi:hypothetical protein
VNDARFIGSYVMVHRRKQITFTELNFNNISTMKQKTDSVNAIQTTLLGKMNNDSELRIFQALNMMVNDLEENERKYHIYPQVGKYAKIFRFVSPSGISKNLKKY